MYLWSVINTNYFISGLVVSFSCCTFRHLAFFPAPHGFMRCTRVALLTHARPFERIIGLPTSQYTNICFPLHALNYISPHLLLEYTQSHRFTNIKYIWRMCVFLYVCDVLMLQCIGRSLVQTSLEFQFIIQNYSSHCYLSSSAGLLELYKSVLQDQFLLIFTNILLSLFLLHLPPFDFIFSTIMHLLTSVAQNN